MTNTKFTPGPWTCLGPSFGDPLPHYTTEIETDWEYEGAENRQICEMPFDYYYEENEANAHLIAAAPELYRLLDESLSYTSCESWSPSLTDEIKAALAKARGEG